MQASTRPTTAPLRPYVHLQIMMAAMLLLKCVTVTYVLRYKCKIKSNVVNNFQKYHTEALKVTDNWKVVYYY